MPRTPGVSELILSSRAQNQEAELKGLPGKRASLCVRGTHADRTLWGREKCLDAYVRVV